MPKDTNNDWFKTWFNTPYYHLLYSNRDEKEAHHFIDRLGEQLQFPQGAHILDVGCGKGRHANYLHSLGFKVTGIDLAVNSIAEAKAMETNGLSYYVHDMRIPFKDSIFDYALNLFTSIGYFEKLSDNEKTIVSCCTALKPNGILVIDFLNAEKVINNLVPQETKQVGNICFELQRIYEQGRIIKKITVIDEHEKYHYEEQVSALGLADFTTYFSVSGMELINLFGNYNLDEFDPSKSERLIMIAQRKN